MFRVFWGDSTLRRYDYFQRNSDRTSWLKAVHSGWFYDTNPIATDHFSEALGGLKVFIYPKVGSWALLSAKRTACSVLARWSLCSPGVSSGTRYCHFLQVLQCTSLGSKKAGRNFAGPARRDHARSAETLLVRPIPP